MAEHAEIAAARLLLLDLEQKSRSAEIVRYELDNARKEIDRLRLERAEAIAWLCRDVNQPHPDSLTHCAAFMHGCYVGATQRANLQDARRAPTD